MNITKKLIEEHWENFTLVTPKELAEKYPIMESLVNTLNWWNNKMVCLRFKDKDNKYGKQGRYRIMLFSEFHDYSIDIAPPKEEGGNPYIGAFCGCRRREPMETWHRGSDLPDGYDGEKTIMKIVMEIVQRELVKLDVEGYDKKNDCTKPWEK